MAEEKDSVSSYLTSDANMTAHADFLREVMSHVSLNDYMAIQRNFILRSEEMVRMKDKVRDMENMVREMTDKHDKNMETMRIELEAHRKTVEELNDGVLNCDLRAQIDRAERAQKFSESNATRTLEQLATLQWKYKNLEQRYEEAQDTSVSSSNMKNIEMEEAYMKQMERLQDALRKERAKTQHVKKTEKDSDKKKAEREKVKREMKEAKERIKALQKALSSSGSDSDSDSYSD
jgi:DNA repair exonuclease SbcCD ATPase subunit